MRRTIKSIFACAAVMCLLLTGCSGSGNENNNIVDTSAMDVPEQTTLPDVYEYDDDETVSVYTGKEVENEEDLAIFKFSAVPPEGYETLIDDSEGKMYASESGGGIIVKAQNYKEEFTDLAAFADQGCAAIKINNMMMQADTEFSEPMDTKVAGFDAVRYDYHVTAYVFLYETDENGEYVIDEEGYPVATGEKEVYREFDNRVYYFYSDEDVFYIICEAPQEIAEEAGKEFDQFIGSVTIEKK